MQFIQGNSPFSLSLGNSNGLTLTGGLAKVLSLPTDSNVIFDGLSLKSDESAGSSQLIFPQGAGGASAPGLRYHGGTTQAGLAVNDGIAEFWDNFSEYCTPVSGHIQGVFRIDTRSGYETESFLLGGKDGSGNQRTLLTADFSNGNVNLSPWGLGSVAIGEESPSSPVSGLDGYLSVKNSIYVGKDLIVQDSTNGMKIGTATSEKIGFWNTTPIVQPTTAIGAATFVTNTSFIADDTATWDGYTIGQVVQALRNVGLLA